MANTQIFIFCICVTYTLCNGDIIGNDEDVNDLEIDSEVCQTMASYIQNKCTKPSVLFLTGGTATGKTALKDIWQKIIEKTDCGYVHIDVEDIRTQLLPWEKWTSGDKAQCAANKLYDAGSRIAKSCFDYMVEHKVNFVYEGTMSRYDETYNLIQKAENGGYQVTMFATTVDTAEAAKRSFSAAKKRMQYVPLCVIVEKHAKFSSNFRSYMALIPSNKLYDTTDKEPKLVVDDNRVVDGERFKVFIDKSSETMESVTRKLNATVKEQYLNMHKLCDMCKGENETFSNKDHDICSELFKNAKTCDKPIAVFIAGDTVAGKASIFEDDVFKMNDCGYCRIDVDDFMIKMLDWKRVTSGDSGKCGGNEMYKRAIELANQCYLQAIAEKKQVAYDGTYSNLDSSVDKMQRAKDSGYDIYLFGVTVNTSVAAERAWKAGETTKQYVPLCRIVETHVGMAQNFVKLASGAKRSKLYDNNSDNPVLIMEDGKTIDENLVNDFKGKADEKFEDVKGQIDKTILGEYEEYHKLCNVCM